MCIIYNSQHFSRIFSGPSFAVDTACSSSLQALQLAVDAMRSGRCTAALVAGTHLNLAPTTALQFKRLGMLSDDGKCKSFDADGKNNNLFELLLGKRFFLHLGEGYVRSEGIAAIFIQRFTDARRCYATVVHALSNTDGFKPQGSFKLSSSSSSMYEDLGHSVGM